jgi:hypothetical protein
MAPEMSRREAEDAHHADRQPGDDVGRGPGEGCLGDVADRLPGGVVLGDETDAIPARVPATTAQNGPIAGRPSIPSGNAWTSRYAAPMKRPAAMKVVSGAPRPGEPFSSTFMAAMPTREAPSPLDHENRQDERVRPQPRRRWRDSWPPAPPWR